MAYDTVYVETQSMALTSIKETGVHKTCWVGPDCTSISCVYRHPSKRPAGHVRLANEGHTIRGEEAYKEANMSFSGARKCCFF